MGETIKKFVERERELQIIKEPERRRVTCVSRVQAWRLWREGKFPKPVRLGDNSIGWLKHEIQEWIAARAAQR